MSPRSRKRPGPAAKMAADDKPIKAELKRNEQVKRWKDSDTDIEPSFPKRKKTTVQFQDGCVFLAACSSGDKAEVEALLQRRADINTVNADGMTALHQACIDDNLEMVEFLVDHGADVDVCDNEGWTPLHATASCAFLDIARYLIKHNANVAAVNNDRDLPIDIADNKEMERLLQDEMDRQGIDAEAARNEEEQRMLADANQWLADKAIKEVQHPKTGATALHVAAAKGYLTVISLLLKAGVDINAEDNDGWTPLQAAAHWEQREACSILVEHLCDMHHKNKAGHTVFDLAEDEMLKLLKELRDKQASIRNEQEKDSDIILSSIHAGKRKSSVTRMSGNQKHNVIQQTSEDERASIRPATTDDKILNTTDRVIDNVETEHQNNDKNKQSSQHHQLPVTSAVSTSTATSRPPSVATSPGDVELRRLTSRTAEQQRPTSVASSSTSSTLQSPLRVATSTSGVELQQPASIATCTPSLHSRLLAAVAASIPTVEQQHPPHINNSVLQLRHFSSPAAHTAGLRLRRPASVATSYPVLELDKPSVARPETRSQTDRQTSTPVILLAPEARSCPLSASVHVRELDIGQSSVQEQLDHTRTSGRGTSISTTTPTTIANTRTSADTEPRNNYNFGQSYSGYRSSFNNRSNTYVPFYLQRQQRQSQATSDSSSNDRSPAPEPGNTTTTSSSTHTGASTTTTSSPAHISASTTTTSSPTHTGALTTTTSSPAHTGGMMSTTTNSVFRRSYEPPKRDEETETQRKARAKHARQTRRSTQGVSLEDIEKAEESIHHGKDSSSPSVHDGPAGNMAATTQAKSVDNRDVAVTTTSSSSTPRASDPDAKEDRLMTSAFRRRASEDKAELTGSSTNRGSYRRSREDRDVNLSTDTTSHYIPRSQRINANQTPDGTTTVTASRSSLRPSALYASDLTDGSTSRKENDARTGEMASKEKKEEKKESTSLRARRQRRERRSTGLGLDSQDGETNDDKDTDADNTDDADGSDHLGPSSDYKPQRTGSSTELSDISYKKKYEEMKTENERLKKELEEAMKGLAEAKLELDRVVRQKDVARSTDRDKRTLERKLSELEEELRKLETLKADNHRLKDENGALIRVISKLSK